jgi:hypothetical protein
MAQAIPLVDLVPAPEREEEEEEEEGNQSCTHGFNGELDGISPLFYTSVRPGRAAAMESISES